MKCQQLRNLNYCSFTLALTLIYKRITMDAFASLGTYVRSWMAMKAGSITLSITYKNIFYKNAQAQILAKK